MCLILQESCHTCVVDNQRQEKTSTSRNVSDSSRKSRFLKQHGSHHANISNSTTQNNGMSFSSSSSMAANLRHSGLPLLQNTPEQKARRVSPNLSTFGVTLSSCNRLGGRKSSSGQLYFVSPAKSAKPQRKRDPKKIRTRSCHLRK